MSFRGRYRLSTILWITLQFLFAITESDRKAMALFAPYVSEFNYAANSHPSVNPGCPKSWDRGSWKERRSPDEGVPVGQEPSIEIRAVLVRCKNSNEKTGEALATGTAYNISAGRSQDILDFNGFDKDEPGGRNSEVKNCRKKLVLTMKFNNVGKTRTQEEFVVVDHVLDPVTMRKARLLNPFVFKVRQEQVLRLYGLKFQSVVNGEVKEEVINKKWSNYTGCDDSLTNPTCGRMIFDGRPVPYSQGFCCSCDPDVNAARQPTGRSSIPRIARSQKLFRPNEDGAKYGDSPILGAGNSPSRGKVEPYIEAVREEASREGKREGEKFRKKSEEVAGSSTSARPKNAGFKAEIVGLEEEYERSKKSRKRIAEIGKKTKCIDFRKLARDRGKREERRAIPPGLEKSSRTIAVRLPKDPRANRRSGNYSDLGSGYRGEFHGSKKKKKKKKKKKVKSSSKDRYGADDESMKRFPKDEFPDGKSRLRGAAQNSEPAVTTRAIGEMEKRNYRYEESASSPKRDYIFLDGNGRNERVKTRFGSLREYLRNSRASNNLSEKIGDDLEMRRMFDRLDSLVVDGIRSRRSVGDRENYPSDEIGDGKESEIDARIEKEFLEITEALEESAKYDEKISSFSDSGESSMEKDSMIRDLAMMLERIPGVDALRTGSNKILENRKSIPVHATGTDDVEKFEDPRTSEDDDGHRIAGKMLRSYSEENGSRGSGIKGSLRAPAKITTVRRRGGGGGGGGETRVYSRSRNERNYKRIKSEGGKSSGSKEYGRDGDSVRREESQTNINDIVKEIIKNDYKTSPSWIGKQGSLKPRKNARRAGLLSYAGEEGEEDIGNNEREEVVRETGRVTASMTTIPIQNYDRGTLSSSSTDSGTRITDSESTVSAEVTRGITGSRSEGEIGTDTGSSVETEAMMIREETTTAASSSSSDAPNSKGDKFSLAFNDEADESIRSSTFSSREEEDREPSRSGEKERANSLRAGGDGAVFRIENSDELEKALDEVRRVFDEGRRDDDITGEKVSTTSLSGESTGGSLRESDSVNEGATTAVQVITDNRVETTIGYKEEIEERMTTTRESGSGVGVTSTGAGGGGGGGGGITTRRVENFDTGEPESLSRGETATSESRQSGTSDPGKARTVVTEDDYYSRSSGAGVAGKSVEETNGKEETPRGSFPLTKTGESTVVLIKTYSLPHHPGDYFDDNKVPRVGVERVLLKKLNSTGALLAPANFPRGRGWSYPRTRNVDEFVINPDKDQGRSHYLLEKKDNRIGSSARNPGKYDRASAMDEESYEKGSTTNRVENLSRGVEFFYDYEQESNATGLRVEPETGIAESNGIGISLTRNHARSGRSGDGDAATEDVEDVKWRGKIDLLKLKKHEDILKEYLNWNPCVETTVMRIFSPVSSPRTENTTPMRDRRGFRSSTKKNYEDGGKFLKNCQRRRATGERFGDREISEKLERSPRNGSVATPASVITENKNDENTKKRRRKSAIGDAAKEKKQRPYDVANFESLDGVEGRTRDARFEKGIVSNDRVGGRRRLMSACRLPGENSAEERREEAVVGGVASKNVRAVREYEDLVPRGTDNDPSSFDYLDSSYKKLKRDKLKSNWEQLVDKVIANNSGRSNNEMEVEAEEGSVDEGPLGKKQQQQQQQQRRAKKQVEEIPLGSSGTSMDKLHFLDADKYINIMAKKISRLSSGEEEPGSTSLGKMIRDLKMRKKKDSVGIARYEGSAAPVEDEGRIDEGDDESGVENDGEEEELQDYYYQPNDNVEKVFKNRADYRDRVPYDRESRLTENSESIVKSEQIFGKLGTDFEISISGKVHINGGSDGEPISLSLEGVSLDNATSDLPPSSSSVRSDNDDKKEPISGGSNVTYIQPKREYIVGDKTAGDLPESMRGFVRIDKVNPDVYESEGSKRWVNPRKTFYNVRVRGHPGYEKLPGNAESEPREVDNEFEKGSENFTDDEPIFDFAKLELRERKPVSGSTTRRGSRRERAMSRDSLKRLEDSVLRSMVEEIPRGRLEEARNRKETEGPRKASGSNGKERKKGVEGIVESEADSGIIKNPAKNLPRKEARLSTDDLSPGSSKAREKTRGGDGTQRVKGVEVSSHGESVPRSRGTGEGSEAEPRREIELKNLMRMIKFVKKMEELVPRYEEEEPETSAEERPEAVVKIQSVLLLPGNGSGIGIGGVGEDQPPSERIVEIGEGVRHAGRAKDKIPDFIILENNPPLNEEDVDGEKRASNIASESHEDDDDRDVKGNSEIGRALEKVENRIGERVEDLESLGRGSRGPTCSGGKEIEEANWENDGSLGTKERISARRDFEYPSNGRGEDNKLRSHSVGSSNEAEVGNEESRGRFVGSKLKDVERLGSYDVVGGAEENPEQREGYKPRPTGQLSREARRQVGFEKDATLEAKLKAKRSTEERLTRKKLSVRGRRREKGKRSHAAAKRGGKKRKKNKKKQKKKKKKKKHGKVKMEAETRDEGKKTKWWPFKRNLLAVIEDQVPEKSASRSSVASSRRKRRQIRDGGTQARGGQDCMDRRHPPHVDSVKYQESAHCLRFSDLWYSVYRLENPIMEHTVYLQLFEKHTLSDGRTHWDDLTQGSMVRLGTFVRRQRDPKATIAFTYTGAKVPNEKQPHGLDPSKDRLLVPSPVPAEKLARYPETKGGSGEYMVVQSDAINRDGSECDKAGVGFAAFATQPNRCGQPQGTCLKNQPLAYRKHDLEAKEAGRPGCYFLSNFASVPKNPIKYNVSGTGGQEYLGLEYHSSHVSAVEVEVRADYNAIVRVGSSGRVTEVSVDSTAPEHTLVTIVITNMGLASSPYQSRITDCPTGLPVSWRRAKGAMQVVPPQHDLRATLDLYGRLYLDGFHCSVEVVNHRGELVAMRRIRIQRTDRCFCVWHCLCSCVGSVAGLRCQPMSNEHYHAAGFQGPVPVPSTESSALGNAVKDVILLSAFVVVILLALGMLKWLIGAFLPSVGRRGLDVLLDGTRFDGYFEPELRRRCIVTDLKGNIVHPDTGEKTVRICSRRAEFFLNLIFFFTYPVAVCCNFARSSLLAGNQNFCRDESKICLLREDNFGIEKAQMIRVSTYGDSRNSIMEAEDTRYVINELKRSKESLEYGVKRSKVGMRNRK